MLSRLVLLSATVFVSGIISSPVIAACTPKHKFTTVNAGSITVAAIIYAPYSSIDDAGNASGIDGELLHAIAAMECLTIKTTPVDAGAAIQSVLAKKTDTAQGDWNRTVARSKVLNLSAPLYIDQMAIYSAKGWDKISDLEGKTFGVLGGSLWDEDLKKAFGDNMKIYPTAAEAVQDLTVGRIAAFVEGMAYAATAKTKGELKDIQVIPAKPDDRVKASTGPGQGCFVVAKDNLDMLKAIDEDLAELRKNGTIEKIMLKYGLPASAAQTGEPSLL